MEGIYNKARVITKRAYGLKSADNLWTRLILDLNRASEAIGRSIEQIRQMVRGLKALLTRPALKNGRPSFFGLHSLRSIRGIGLSGAEVRCSLYNLAARELAQAI